MEALLTAIYTKCVNTPAVVTAFPAFATWPVAVYRDRAPENAPLPFAVLTAIAAPSTHRYGGESFNEPSVQVSAYGVGSSATFTLLGTIITALDETTLTLGAGHMTNTYREGAPMPMVQDDKDVSGNNVWAWHVVYSFAVSPR